jgi:hypothetical protein
VRRLRRGAALALSFAFVAGSTFGITVASPVDANAATNSAVTVSGKGEFDSLKVTVDQTKNLVDQVVRISWKGGTPTRPSPGSFASDYLQIMQCWGDDPDGPDREQCQFGGLEYDPRGGAQTYSRQLNVDGVVDPKETIKPPAPTPSNPSPQAYVPFVAFDGERSEGGVSTSFDRYSTNEVPYAPTLADGTGQVFFTMQTVKDAAGLGCGEPQTKAGRTVGRSCWLAIVPRGRLEVDGEPSRASNGRLQTSPLSQSNWDNRIVVPLEFEPAGRACPIGQAERKISGHELVGEAILRWQPTLCAGGGTVYGYSTLGDDAARRELKTPDPGMVVLSKPLTAAENPDRTPVVYAPMTISGLTVAYNVESQSPGNAPPAVKLRDGTRLTDMKLTPRHVAKLLTMSYKRGVDVRAASVEGNPTDLTRDEDFLRLNPQFKGLAQGVSMPSLLLPLGRSDVAEQVWAWLLADKDAKAFLAGEPDPWGMRINPSFKDLPLPRQDYPKSDPYCRPPANGAPEQCMLEVHPYANDMRDAARAAARGDLLSRGIWDQFAIPEPAWTKDPPQLSGTRSLLALVDTASAARYGLEVASLQNAAGKFVPPTPAALQANVKQMQPGPVPSVLAAAPTAKDPKAYPLASVSYAAAAPEKLAAQERTDYANLLRYAADKGQTPGIVPGTLPAGYAPLTTELRAELRKAADLLVAGEGSPGSTGTDEGDKPPSKKLGDGDLPGTSLGLDPAGTTGIDGGASDPSTAGTEITDAGATTLASGATPFDLAGLIRFVPAFVFVLGLLAVLGGPALLWWLHRTETTDSARSAAA